MKELLEKIFEEGDWKPLRFTVYNYLEEKERYQQNLEHLGYDGSYDDLVGKIINVDNETAKQFKSYVENKLQDNKVIVAVCIIDKSNYITVVKPKDADAISILNTNQS
jgi:hypothetical protein